MDTSNWELKKKKVLISLAFSHSHVSALQRSLISRVEANKIQNYCSFVSGVWPPKNSFLQQCQQKRSSSKNHTLTGILWRSANRWALEVGTLCSLISHLLPMRRRGTSCVSWCLLHSSTQWGKLCKRNTPHSNRLLCPPLPVARASSRKKPGH